MITDIIIHRKGDPPFWPDLARVAPAHHGEVERVAVLDEGMASGRPSVVLGGREDSGQWFGVETSAEHILVLAAMICGWYPELDQ